MSMARSALCVSLASLSNPLEHSFELLVLVVPDLAKFRRIVPLPKKDHPVVWQSHDLVGIDEVASGNMLRIRLLAFTVRRRHVMRTRLPIERATSSAVSMSFTPNTCSTAGIGKEGVGAFAVECTQLMNVLKDRPELHAIPCHQPHGTLDGI